MIELHHILRNNNVFQHFLQPQDAPQQHQAPQTPEQQAQQEARQAQRLARARALAQAQAREREQGIQARQQLAQSSKQIGHCFASVSSTCV